MKRISILLVAATSFAVPACTSDAPENGPPDNMGSGSENVGDEWDQLLGTREYDYSAALKIAALRLTGDLPTMDEILSIQNAGDLAAKKLAYEALLQDYMARPAFARQMMAFWRDTFKMGDSAELDSAPAFATALTVANRSYLELFTASNGNCGTFDASTSTVTTADCTGGGPQAGVLTNQGAMKQFFSNFAFRRVRWVQETFDCAQFPVELVELTDETPKVGPDGDKVYLGAWPFESISGATTNVGRVDFQDTTSVMCTHCHQSLNHTAPLFAYYDIQGKYQPTISVPTPLDGAPMAKLDDYIPGSETTAWRYQVPAADLPALGAAMAADPSVQVCGVVRAWNFALGKADVVDALVDVPKGTIAAQIAKFSDNGFKLKDMIFDVFASEDFTKF